MASTEYAVVGGGIVGASVAYHLSRRTDDPVTVYERGDPASETTARSLAMFGLYGDETQYRMKRYGMELYNEFFADPRTDDLEYTFAGRLRIATSEDGAALFRRVVEGETETDLAILGRDLERGQYRYIPGEDLEREFVVPEIDTDPIVGALYRPTAGFMNAPKSLAREFLERAVENGVAVEDHTRVEAVRVEDGRAVGVETADGPVEASEVVCAAGPWNVGLARSVGIDLPVRHLRTPVFTVRSETPAGYVHPTLEHHESDYHFYRRRHDAYDVVYWPATYEAGEQYDPDSLDETIPEEIRDGLHETLELLAPSLVDAEIEEEWVCTISVTPDGNPIVGWTDLEGFSIAAFHTSGIQLAPAVGRMIARQLVDGDPTDHYEALSISRFDGHTDWRDGVR